MSRSIARRLLCIVACGLIIVSCAGRSSSDPDRRADVSSPTAIDEALSPAVAFLNQGQAASDVWTAAHRNATREVEAALSDEIDVRFIESVPLEEAGDIIDRLIADGVGLVVTTSIGFEQTVLAAAERHPSVHFEQARGGEIRPNVGTFAGADEQPLYLAGMAAGGGDHGGLIGFVGTVPEAETIRHINAFTLGAQSVDPNVRVEVRWVGSWFDPEREGDLARQLVARGAGIIATGAISPSTGRVARDLGVGWVSHDADRSVDFPEVWITAAVPNWGPFYLGTVRTHLAGRWEADAYYGDMSDGFTDIARLGSLVEEPIRGEVLERRKQLLGGTFELFVGPLVDQAGVERVPAGSVLSVEDALRWDWFVDGVDGSADG